MRLAVTGGTGFVGSHLIDVALAAGHSIIALTRRPQSARPNLRWVEGDLSKSGALRALIDDTDAVIHVAGVINARDAAAFEAGNVGGTLATLAAATAGGTCRFVHISSLAAREPQLSLYGASKARAEVLVERSRLDWAIVRPPAVYGPGDRETLELFRLARLGLMFVPAGGRLSLIHVDDLARLLLALADADAPSHVLIEADDGRPGGWTRKDFASALGRALGARPLVIPAGRTLLNLAAWTDRFIRRDKAKLTPDRVAYFAHPDWVVDPTRACPPDWWQPQISTEQGLADTASWYRANSWL
jgi:nucleoside-diphosphate-sugar epimerase